MPRARPFCLGVLVFLALISVVCATSPRPAAWRLPTRSVAWAPGETLLASILVRRRCHKSDDIVDSSPVPAGQQTNSDTGETATHDATAQLAIGLATVALRVLANKAGDNISDMPSRSRNYSLPLQAAAAQLAVELSREEHFALSTVFTQPDFAAVARELQGVRCVGHHNRTGAIGVASDLSKDEILPRQDTTTPSPHGQYTDEARASNQLSDRSNHTRYGYMHRESPENATAGLLSTGQDMEKGVVEDERAALLATFVRDPNAAAAWRALRGWNTTTTPPCGTNRQVPCTDNEYDNQHGAGECKNLISSGFSCVADFCASCEFAQYCDRSCGFVCTESTGETWEGITCGSNGYTGRVTAVILQNLPDLKFELSSHWIDGLDALLQIVVSNTGLSGTIPSALSKLPGQLPLLQLYLNDNPRLSGTIPRQLGELVMLQRLSFSGNPSLSGTIPSEIGKMGGLQQLFLNNIPLLSGTIPSEVRKINHTQIILMNSNPLLSGTIPVEIGELSKLQGLKLNNNVMLSGSVPSLHGCTSLQSADFHSGSFTRLPTSMPDSITHLFLNKNPIHAHSANLSSFLGTVPALKVFAAGFINSNIQLQYNQSTCTAIGGRLMSGCGLGARVINPRKCHLGSPCAFVLYMYDDHDQPMTEGGLVHNLTLHLGGSVVPMVDNRDGTFEAAVPDEWVHSTGIYIFNFFHSDVEFTPMMETTRDGDDGNIAVASDCIKLWSDPDEPPSYGGQCAGLRTVGFLPRHCTGSHTHPDNATGASCVCDYGFEVDVGVNETAPSCHRRCGPGEAVGSDGSSCGCTGNTYNTNEHGVLICNVGGWKRAEVEYSYEDAQISRASGIKCVPCPTECVRCTDGAVTVLAGWRLNASSDADMMTQLAHGHSGRPQHIFSCPYSQGACPSIELSTATIASITCLGYHDGALCATCKAGYIRRSSSDNQCEECQDLRDYIRHKFGISPGWFAICLTIVLLTACVIVFLGKLLLAKVLWIKSATKTNRRILLGSAQVLSLLPSILELEYPPSPDTMFSFAALGYWTRPTLAGPAPDHRVVRLV